MPNDNSCETCGAGVKTYVRNRYFYGKLLDVYHFETEQKYFIEKRWLLNRLVTGYGVVCGLDVQVGKDGNSVIVLPGVAIDKWGREIIVPSATNPLPLPPPSTDGTVLMDDPNCVDGNYVHVCLCYYECESDPVPALGCDCDQNALCSPGAIRERYEIKIRNGKLPNIATDCTVPDLVAGGKINYPALAQYVSAPCRECPDDPCIALANVELPQGGGMVQAEQIDIAIRPIVYTLDLLRDLLVCLTNKTPIPELRGGKS